MTRSAKSGEGVQRSARPHEPPRARPLRTVRAHTTRDRILDAAEELFASRGFHGVSIRDITEAASVQLALANYHFGTKQQLYSQVIERRGYEHAAQMQRYLDEALAGQRDRPLPPEKVIGALCESIFDRLITGGEGWRRYIRLLAWTAESSQVERFVGPMNRIFDPVLQNYIRALRRAYPRLSATDFYAGYYFVQSGLVYTVAATGGIDRLSRGALKSRDFKRLLPRLVKFLVGGFDRLGRADR
jgi:AcrR family transcriptional regulator